MRVEEERMKESWMDKLIELLNEYEDWMFSWVKEYSEEFGVFVLNTEQMIEEEIIISKSFGFIWWLVENDKIDFSWEWKLSLDLVALFERKVDNADWVIALLSISDNPIEDLVSYLK